MCLPNTTDNANTNYDVTLPRAVGVASPVFIAPLSNSLLL